MVGPFELGGDGPAVVLVGVDGSPTSLRAAAYAAGLARRSRARLVVVHVSSAPLMSGFAPTAAVTADTLAQLADDLATQVREGADRLGIAAEFVVHNGDPFTEIASVADDARADAVVVGASKQAGHRLVGSIAVRLVRAGRWPVTVVP